VSVNETSSDTPTASRDLHLDVNLLTSVFPEALADALERIEGQAVEAALREEQRRAVAARAS